MRKVDISILAFLLLGINLLFIERLGTLTGPFIFGDEAEYFNLARVLFQKGEFLPGQYPILYPLVISPFFWLLQQAGPFLVYKCVIYFGMFVFSLSLIPIYLLFQTELQDRVCSSVIATAIVCLPWSSYIGMVWAEPLFYFLYSLFWYFVLRPKPSFKVATLIATALFLTKQHAVFVIIPFFAWLSWQALRSQNKMTWAELFKCISIFGFVVSSYIVFQRLTAPQVEIGYRHLNNLSPVTFLKTFLTGGFWSSFFHQISFLLCASLLFLTEPVLMLLGYSSNKNRSRVLFVLGTALFGCIAIALFYSNLMRAYGIPDEPALMGGRYFSPLLFPIFWLGICSLQEKSPKKTWQLRTALTILAGIVVFACSPLRSLYAIAIPNVADLNYLVSFFHFNHPPWEREKIEAIASRSAGMIALGFVFAYFVTSVLFYKKRRRAFAVLFLIFSLWTGDVQFANIRYLSDVTEPENSAFRNMTNQKINIHDVFYFSDWKPEYYQVRFWYGGAVENVWFDTNKAEPSKLTDQHEYLLLRNESNPPATHSEKVFATRGYSLYRRRKS